METPLVSICCLTYNHSKYIRQCLDGFMIQKTSFSFEVLIHDDASTDGTQEIIDEYKNRYPDIIKPIYQKENQYSKGINVSKVYQFSRAKGKYIALCEGDDYWTDSFKLQKQVNAIEQDDKIGFVYTKFKLVDCENNTIDYIRSVEQQFAKSKSGLLFPILLKNNFPQTLTVLFRKELLDGVEEYYRFVYDWPIFLHICGQCKSVFLNEIMGCYRINPNGIMVSGKLRELDNNGRTTLSGAFNGYLDGKYTYVTWFDDILIRLRIYYKVLQGNLLDLNLIEKKINNNIFYKLLIPFRCIIRK